MVRSPSRLVSCGRTTCRPGRSTSGNRLRKEGLTRQRRSALEYLMHFMQEALRFSL